MGVPAKAVTVKLFNALLPKNEKGRVSAQEPELLVKFRTNVHTVRPKTDFQSETNDQGNVMKEGKRQLFSRKFL